MPIFFRVSGRVREGADHTFVMPVGRYTRALPSPPVQSIESIRMRSSPASHQPAPNSLRDRLTRTYSPDGAGDVERRLAG